MAASKRANGVPSALAARQSLNDEELVGDVFIYVASHDVTSTSNIDQCGGVQGPIAKLSPISVVDEPFCTKMHSRQTTGNRMQHGFQPTMYM